MAFISLVALLTHWTSLPPSVTSSCQQLSLTVSSPLHRVLCLQFPEPLLSLLVLDSSYPFTSLHVYLVPSLVLDSPVRSSSSFPALMPIPSLVLPPLSPGSFAPLFLPAIPAAFWSTGLVRTSAPQDYRAGSTGTGEIARASVTGSPVTETRACLGTLIALDYRHEPTTSYNPPL
eukprot:749933-Hanusia_phi.AAC.3